MVYPPIKSQDVILHDSRGNLAIIERDVQRVLAWLAEDPLRTVTSRKMLAFVDAQYPEWSRGYWRAIKERVDRVLLDATGEAGPIVKARLLSFIDEMLPLCRTYKTGSGGSSEEGSAGTVVLTDPKTGELLTEVNHTAVQGYLKLIAQLHGITNEEHKHVHLHGALKHGDLSEVPEAELIAAMQIAPQP